MPKIFLSYRRDDTGGEVGRLSDGLKQQLGRRFVFRDVSDIAAGAAFDVALEAELAAAKVVLVLIGPDWLGELQRRLQESGVDYLRKEVATALSKGKRVIPVLLKGATLPAAAALPPDLALLEKRQALSLRDEAWSSDVNRLIEAIGRPYQWGRPILRAAIVLPTIIVAVWALVPQLAGDRVSDYAFMRRMVLSLVAIYGMIELVLAWLHQRKLARNYVRHP